MSEMEAESALSGGAEGERRGVERVTNQLIDIDANAKTIASAIETVRAYVLSIERSLVSANVAIPARVTLFTREDDAAADGKTVHVRARTTSHLEYRKIDETWKVVIVDAREEWVKVHPADGHWSATTASICAIADAAPEILLSAAPHAGKLLAAIARRQDEIKEQVEVAVWSSVLDAIAIGHTDLVEQLREAESLLKGYRSRSG